jgi:hypothetical protein
MLNDQDQIPAATITPTVTRAIGRGLIHGAYRIVIAIAIALITGLLLTAATSLIEACHTAPIVAVIDCTEQNQPAIQALIAQMEPLIEGDSPNWPQALADAEAAGVAIGGCALAILVETYTTAPNTQGTTNATTARATLEQMRLQANGSTFHTAQGDF